MSGDYVPFPVRIEGVDFDHVADINPPNQALGWATAGRTSILATRNGGKGDGTTDDSGHLATMDANAGAEGATGYVPRNTAGYALAVSKTLTSPLRLEGKLLLAGGVTLTINGPLSPPPGPYQVFGGAGTVAFGPGSIDGIRPEWFRAPGDADDTNGWTKAINAANAMTAAQGKVIGLPGKQYVVSASLPTVSRNVIVDLCGASISHTATSGSLFTFAGVTSWTPGGLRNGQLVGSSVGTSIGVTIGSGGTASEGVLLEKLDIAGFNDGVSFVGSAGMPFATLLDNCKVHNNNRYGCVFNTGACENLMFLETYVFNNLAGGYVVLGTSNLEIRLLGGGVDGNGDATHPGVYFADGTTVIFTAVNTHFEWPNTGTDPQMIRSDAGATGGSATIELAMGSHGMSVGTVTQPSIQICFGTLTITGGSVSASTLNAALIQLGDSNNKSVTFRMVNAILWCNGFGGTPWFVNTVTTAPIYYYVMGNQCSGLATTPIANWGSNAGSWGKTDMDAVIGPTGDLLMTGRLQAQTLASTGHLTATGPAATITPGVNAGTSPPAITIKQGGNDICGTIGFGTGTTPGSGEMVQVVFAVPYSAVPMVTVTANNAATGAFFVHPGHRLTTGFTINFESTPPGSQAADFYEVNYVVIGVA